VLNLLGVKSVRLMTNNPEKVQALESAGITVAERVSAEVEPLETFAEYVRVKQEKMGHITDMVQDEKPA
jgi:GTP cyclohydrolase II